MDMNHASLLEIISKLLLKASVHEELIRNSDHDKTIVAAVLQMLKAREPVQRNALMILQNLSFWEHFYQVISTRDFYIEVFRQLHDSVNTKECLNLVYQMSKVKESRLVLASPEYINQIVGLLLQRSRPTHFTELCAILINVSLSRCFLELFCDLIFMLTLCFFHK